MTSYLTCIACFAFLVGIVSCNYQMKDIFKDIYNGKKSEKDLRHHLFQNYDKFVRPVKNAADQLTGYVGLSVLHIRSLTESDQILTLETFTQMKWTDDYLKWDPSRFGNITELRIPSTEVWRPDFAVYTAPDQSVMFPAPVTNVIAYHNGMVLWVPMFAIKSHCPFSRGANKVICNIKIGSWTFSGPVLDIQLFKEEADMSYFVDGNPHWKLVGIETNRESKYYPCCPEPYPVLHFNVTLKRRMDSLPTISSVDYESD